MTGTGTSTGSSDRSPSARADVCIIGAGPAGALLADSLARRGHEVVVLEAGERFDFSSRPDRMERALRSSVDIGEIWDMGGARDAFTSSGNVFYPVNGKRVKGIGGSTLHWGGRVARFPEKDFEMNTRYGVATDWPIDYSDLRPYYARAEHELGVAGAEDNPFGPPREESYPMEAFPPSKSDAMFADACAEVGITVHSVPNARNSVAYDDRSECVGYGTCSPVCPSGAKYSADVHVRKAEKNGARVIDRATVQRLVTTDDGTRITAAVYRTPDGRVHRQTGREFVLAAGGIENARLLLLSRSEAHPDGLANESGTVGKFFMESPYVGIVGEVDAPTKQHHIGFGTMESYQFYEPSEVPPGSFKIEFNNHAGPTVVELALRQRNPLWDLRAALGDPTSVESLEDLGQDLAPMEWGDELLETIDERYGNYFSVLAEIEVLPRPQNRVTLNPEETDAFGNPVPDISWGEFGSYETETMDRAFEVLESIVEHLEPDVKWSRRVRFLRGVGHHSGTTRMGTDPRESVVDPDLRAHGVGNLSVVGSSTFVTSGASQPTLTIAALALRLADHLDDRLRIE